VKNLFLRGDRNLGKSLQEAEDPAAVAQVPARQFAHDERVDHDLAVLEKGAEPGVPGPEVLDPDRRVYQDHQSDP
jgi:hypothetical protein